MTAYPAWTPASRPGIVPLHPLSFGMILGRSFAALRQNPRVLLGFALIVQTLAYFVVMAAVAAIAWTAFARLDTLRPGTDEYNTVLAGSIGITAVAGIVLGLAAGALGVIIQAVVVVEVTHAAVAEKLSLGALWRQVKPIVWRLIGYSALVFLALIALVAVVALAVVGVALVAPAAAIGIAILVILAAIPLMWWLMIKLLLVPAAIIIEHATIAQALSRSWTLTKGRFWPILGIIVVISAIFSAVAQVISIPFAFLSVGLSTIIAPTGAPDPSAIVGVLVTMLLTQAVTLLLQAVAVVVQSTATAIIYIDCRMRREGLDLDLLAYVERRDAGAADLADPYREHVGRLVAARGWQAAAAYGMPGPAIPAPAVAAPQYAPYPAPYPQTVHPQGGYAAQPGYVQPGYAQPGYLQPGYVQPGDAPTGYPQQHVSPPSQTEAGALPAPAEPGTERNSEQPATSWTAPGAARESNDRDSPWS